MSNSKDPAFLFYSADFLVGVMDLTDEETGQYIKLICLQHQKGRLKKESIYRMFPNISDCVLEKFEIDENGLYYNPRVEEEIEKRENFVRARQINGAKGGRPPKCDCANNLNETDRLSVGKPKQNLSENENENINEDINDIDNNLYFQWFNEFWNIYPKKMNKERAKCAFMRIKPNEQLFAQMKSALEKQKRSKQWQDAQFIPYASTWLNGKRWEDEVSERDCSSFDVKEAYKIALNRKYPSKEKEEKESSFDTEDFFQTALERSYGK